MLSTPNLLLETKINIIENILLCEEPLNNEKKETFFKENKFLKIGLEIFTTFKRSDSKTEIINNLLKVPSKNKFENLKIKKPNNEKLSIYKNYLNKRHFDTTEKINKMRSIDYSDRELNNKDKPELSKNTLLICEKLAENDKTLKTNEVFIGLNKIKITLKKKTRNMSEKNKISQNTSTEIITKNVLKLKNNEFLNKNDSNRNSIPLTRSCSYLIMTNKDYKINDPRKNNFFLHKTYHVLDKRMTELNNFKDHLSKNVAIGRKEHDKNSKYSTFRRNSDCHYDDLEKSVLKINENAKKLLQKK